MDDLELKPCPFCGSFATVWFTMGKYIVECDNDSCGCSYGNQLQLDFEEVIESWNSRINS